MQISEFERILDQFASELRQGLVVSDQRTQNEIAELARQLEQALAAARRRHVVKSDTISFSPAKCPCCGR